MGLDDRGLARAGVRILHPRMIWPLDPEVVREFAAGLDEIVVVEEKRPFLERQLKEILYGDPGAPRILGKVDERGAELLPAEGELDADVIARALGPRLLLHGSIASVEGRLRKLAESASRPLRCRWRRARPFFCSGCPHNSSTPAPDGTLVGAGIGCHTMILLNPEGRGDITGITQMGGEGAQWIGMAPFTDDDHFVQNLGDGTFHHSGSLAVRAAVAAGVNVTYKLFYNDAVAMTGGQAVEGQIPIPDLTRWLEIEGVKRIIVTTEDTKRYRGVRLAPIAEVRDRDELLAAQEELAAEPGVTVLIHDQECAAEKRRKRKRGKLEDPPERVYINERVCEGCGDCGAKSGCLSVLPVETEFGRKTQIHQSSCNKDYSCLDGDCPSFLTVIPPKKKRARAAGASTPLGRAARPASPVRCVRVHAADDGNRRHRRRDGQPGHRRRGTAGRPPRGRARPDRASARRAGRWCPTCASRASRSRARTASRRRARTSTSASTCSAPRARRTSTVADPDRTVAVISTTAVPTGAMVLDPSQGFPEVDGQIQAIDIVTRREHNVYLDAQRLAEEAPRRPHAREHARSRRRMAARRASDLAVLARGGDQAERRRGREEPRRVRVGPRVRRSTRRRLPTPSFRRSRSGPMGSRACSRCACRS